MGEYEYALEVRKVNKSFPGVQALSNVDMALKKGEVLGLVGENGAGKSTLIKCLGGIHQIDSGEMFVRGEKVHLGNVFDSLRLGIGIIHQELVLSEQLTVADNIFMGREHVKRSGVIDRKKTFAEAQKILDRVGGDVKAGAVVSNLTTAEKQIVEIAKTLSMDADIIIMDEPTSMLTNAEVGRLFDLVRQLRQEGLSIVFISHRMPELFEITDRITVIRDGKTICTVDTDKTDSKELIGHMVGRSLDEYYAREKRHELGEVILEVKNFTRVDKRVKDASFYLHKGEIIGFAGLVGAGRSELMRMVFGLDDIANGEMVLYGEKVTFKNSAEAMARGIGFATEDRKLEGLFLEKDVGFNLTIGVLEKFLGAGRLNAAVENSIIEEYANDLDIKMSSKRQIVMNLSGGNQQKVVLAKWLAISPKILILDEPTRGIDVGAKREIYEIINELLEQGISIIMVSSELPELINICDRIYVMMEGEIKACLSGDEVSQEAILEHALEV
jgi:ABC-type sugar transport system ATPase subunit